MVKAARIGNSDPAGRTKGMRRMTRTTPLRTLLGVLVALLLATLSACGGGREVDMDDEGGDSAGGEGGTLIAAIGGEPDQLDPHVTSSYFSFQVLENVYDTLVEPDEDLAMQPALAESWETSDDGLTWTFTLREGVTFHDGSDFTADDVVYSFNRIIDEELSTSWRFSAVKSVKAVDDTTVEIKVNQPSPNLLANIGGFKGVAIVSEDNVKSGDIKTEPIGTGPFQVDSFTPGDSIDLSANPDYWGGAPALDGVTFQFIPEASTAMAALRSGEVHWTDSVPPQEVDSLGDDDTLEVGQVGSNDYWYLATNEARPPFDDERVRQAIAYAIDREAITESVMYGNATVNQLAIPESSSWYTEYAPYSTDPDKAEELLAEAGVEDLKMEIMVSSDYPETVTAAQVIADQLDEVGIDLEIRTLDFGTWLDEQGEGNWDMLMMGWLGNIDPDDFYYGQHHSKGTNNYQKYSNPEVDQLLDEGRVETDEEARKELYAEAAQIIADEASYIYLYNPDVLQVWSTDLSGYTVRGDRAIRFRDVSLG